MSTLADRLERIKASFLKQAPAEAVEVMDRATNELRDSGITSRLPEAGSPLKSSRAKSSGWLDETAVEKRHC